MGLLLWSALYFFLSGEELLSLLAAVIAHEVGHVLALALFGVRVDVIALTGTGMRIDYACALSPVEELISAAAGPLFGALWFFAALRLGFSLSAWLSILLTAFNLLPLSAMDGGKVVGAAVRLISGGRAAKRISLILDIAMSSVMCIAALWCAYNGFGAGAAVAAAWLVGYTALTPCKTHGLSIK